MCTVRITAGRNKNLPRSSRNTTGFTMPGGSHSSSSPTLSIHPEPLSKLAETLAARDLLPVGNCSGALHIWSTAARLGSCCGLHGEVWGAQPRQEVGTAGSCQHCPSAPAHAHRVYLRRKKTPKPSFLQGIGHSRFSVSVRSEG